MTFQLDLNMISTSVDPSVESCFDDHVDNFFSLGFRGSSVRTVSYADDDLFRCTDFSIGERNSKFEGSADGRSS